MFGRITLALSLVLVACGQGGSNGPSTTGGAGGDEGTGGAPPRAGTGGGKAGSGGSGGSGGTTAPDGSAPDSAPTQPPPDAGAEETGGAADTAPSSALVCPPGPFEAPRAGERKNICPGFNVKYNW